MTEQSRSEITHIDVIPDAGAQLNRGADWRDEDWVEDSASDLSGMVSSVTADEMSSFLREEHHNVYGRPWSLGRYYDNYLLQRRVSGKDRVLDFGCGAGRLGHLLAARLDPGCYVGVDTHLLSLKAFAAYEIPLHRLEDREPALLWGSVESLRFFQPGYSVVLDLFTSLHMSEQVRLSYFAEVRRLLSPDGRLISLSTGSDVAQAALSCGLVISHKQVQDLPLLWPLRRKKRINSWIEFSAASS